MILNRSFAKGSAIGSSIITIVTNVFTAYAVNSIGGFEVHKILMENILLRYVYLLQKCHQVCVSSVDIDIGWDVKPRKHLWWVMCMELRVCTIMLVAFEPKFDFDQKQPFWYKTLIWICSHQKGAIVVRPQYVKTGISCLRIPKKQPIQRFGFCVYPYWLYTNQSVSD